MADRLVVLDAQRGLCALFVALLHANGASHIHDSAFVQGSWLFVDFFFVLSGFVIALVYVDRIDSAASFVAFVIRRFGRLWPLHASVLLLYVASDVIKAAASHYAGLPVHVAAFSGSPPLATLGANLLLVHSLGLLDTFSWNAPSWSISVEFYTYLIFAALCLAVRRWMVAAAAVASGVGILVLVAFSTEYLGASLDWGIFRCVYGFFIGVLTLFAYRAACRRSRRLPLASVLEVGALIFAALLVVAGRDGGPVTMFAPVVFAVIVFTFAFEAGVVSRLLKAPAFMWLGDRSYAIYMIHALTGDTIVRVLLFVAALTPLRILTIASSPGNTGFAVSFGDRYVTDLYVIFYIAAALICADLVHRAIERPGRALFNKAAASYLRRRTKLVAPAVI